jgi:hypothetical protein
VSCDTAAAAYRRCIRGNFGGRLEVLVRGAVVAVGQRRALARLALPRGGAAAGNPAVERAGLDLLLDEAAGGADALVHGPRDLGLSRDREVAADVLEERPVRLREVERIGCEAGHRGLAVLQHRAAGGEPCLEVGVRVDEVLHRTVDGSRVLIHAALQPLGSLVEFHVCLSSR